MKKGHKIWAWVNLPSLFMRKMGPNFREEVLKSFQNSDDVTAVHDQSSFNNSREVSKVQLGHSDFIM